jgi:hypothetical protein
MSKTIVSDYQTPFCWKDRVKKLVFICWNVVICVFSDK